MSIPTNEQAKNEGMCATEVKLNAFLNPGPINILKVIGEAGRISKSKLLEEKGTGVHWPTYSRYEKALIDAGLIKIEEEGGFPFRQTITITEKGREVLSLLDKISDLIWITSDGADLGEP